MQLTRLRAENFFIAAAGTNRLLPGDPGRAVEFGVIARVSLPDWIRGNQVVRPDAPAEEISIRKLAASLSRSAETVRRHVHALRDAGVVTLSPTGLSLARTEENAERMRGYCVNVHDSFVRLIEDIHRTCDIEFAVADNPGFGMQDVIERSMDLLLAAIDTYTIPARGKISHFVWGALCAVAVRHVTFDPVLSRLYANQRPPNEVRGSISLRRLAAALKLPYATVWRTLGELQEHGLVTRLAGDRWTVHVENLLTHAAVSIVESPAMAMLRKVRELAAMGFDPAQAGRHYLAGRPPIADLGLE